MNKSPFEDPVVSEIHRIRAEMLAECGGDWQVLLEQVRLQQQASGRKVRTAPIPMPLLKGNFLAPGTAGQTADSQ